MLKSGSTASCGRHSCAGTSHRLLPPKQRFAVGVCPVLARHIRRGLSLTPCSTASDEFWGASSSQHHASPSPPPRPWASQQPNMWGEPSPWDVHHKVWWGFTRAGTNSGDTQGQAGSTLDSCQYRSSSPSPSQGPSGLAQTTLDSWDFNDSPAISPPSTSSLPSVNDSDQLLFPPSLGPWTLTDRPGIDLREAGLGVVSHVNRVYVILFGVGQKETEGIYSLRAFSDDGLPQETIIVFESEEDATRYASLLEAAMDGHSPSVCSIPPAELLEFCNESGYECRLEPHGSLLIPPDFNVSVTDWERSLRLREGQYAVLEAEPHGSQVDHHFGTSTQVASHTLLPPAWPQDMPAGMARYRPSFSEEELAQIRAKLESLLPVSDSDADDM